MNNYAIITLSRGLNSIIDESDFDAVAAWRWHAIDGHGRGFYAAGQPFGKRTYLHRFILGAPKGVFVDHINRNCLDNRRSNLRLCSHKENATAGIRRYGDCEYRGVNKCPTTGRYIARITRDGSKIYLGRFDTQREAAIVRDMASIMLHGKFAWLNFPDEMAAAAKSIGALDGAAKAVGGK